MRLIFDIEADALLDGITQVHCLVIKNLDTSEVMSCTDASPKYPTIDEGLSLLSEATVLYAHNGIRYDFPALKLVRGWEPSDDTIIRDTLLTSQVRFAHIRDLDYEQARRGKHPSNLIGWHSLEAWGHRLGLHKGNYEGGWEKWNEAMMRYCELDVEVTHALIFHLQKAGIPNEALDMEHELATYLFQQEQNGWPFDMQEAIRLQSHLAEERETIAQQLRETFGSWFVPDGKPVAPKTNRTLRKGQPCPTHYLKDAEYQKVKLVEFNPGSRAHIAKVLMERGWKPSQFTASGQPKVDESVMGGIDIPEAKLLMEYLMLDKRLGQLSEGKEAWMSAVEPNEATGCLHIHHRCRNGPRTHRMAHSGPNLGQVPRVGTRYGEECRSLFVVPEGWVMLGADVSGLELRVLAHYMSKWDNGEYIERVQGERPNDVHSINAELLGVTRDQSKTLSYALIYGAGDAKLGSTLLPHASETKQRKEGKRIRALIAEKIPALSKLTNATRSVFDRKGYVRLIDKRRAYPKANYSSLNTLLQGTGAIVTKLWYVLVCRNLEKTYGPQGWDGKWAVLGYVHDEIQIAVRPEIAQMAGATMLKSITEAGNILAVRPPLTGEFAVGRSWAETH
jgi:DNA polymerase I-like protein with 3'-5' exonuclease and polymerase domains